MARVAVARPHRLPALTSTVNRFGQDAADEGIGFEILFNPGLVQVESVDTDTGNELDELPEPCSGVGCRISSERSTVGSCVKSTSPSICCQSVITGQGRTDFVVSAVMEADGFQMVENKGVEESIGEFGSHTSHHACNTFGRRVIFPP